MSEQMPAGKNVDSNTLLYQLRSWSNGLPGDIRAMREAADEIERLQTENQRMRSAIEFALSDSESGHGWGPFVGRSCDG